MSLIYRLKWFHLTEGDMTCTTVISVMTYFMVLLYPQSSYCAEIIGGREVTPHSLPHMALLEGSKGPGCGGTLIHPKWVLTAAHCTKIEKVLLGVHSIKNQEKESRQTLKVKAHVPHPCFDETTKQNDLMLLKLDKRVKLTKKVKCLAVPKTLPEPSAGSTCLVAGWGRTIGWTKNPKMSDVLMSVNVTVIDREKCNSPEYYNFKPIITGNMICAGSVDKNTGDTCQGDSGGPLQCNGVLVGVTSFGPRTCGQKNKPGVYSFLSKKHIDWIKKTIKK